MTGDLELRRTFYLLGSLALVGGLLYWAAPFMIPVTIAVLATFVLTPMAARMERWGIRRYIASTIAVLGAAMVLGGIVYVFVLQLSSLTSDFPAFKTRLSDKIGDLRQATANSWLVDAMDFANEFGKTPAKDPGQEPKGDHVVAKMEVSLVPVIQSVAGTLAQLLISAVLVLVLTILMLIRREDLRNRMIYLLGARRLVSATRAVDDASKRISNFLFCQLIVNVGFGAVVAIGLFFIGIPYAYVWGALAALLRYIPYLGGWIAAAFPLLASLVMPDWTAFVLTGAFFVVVELLQAYLVEPLVFGHSIGVSGVGQLIAALFWACLWGPVGLILSTPLTACLCVLGRYFSVLRFFFTLMGEDEGVEKSAAFYQRLVAGDSTEASDLVEGFLEEPSASQVIDVMLLPALISGQSDYKNGELSKDDQVSITETVREIFYDVVAPFEKEQREESAPSENRNTHVLVLECPFNDDIDDLIVEMLKNTSDTNQWTTITLKNSHLDGFPQPEEGEPSVILLATSAKKNLARIRAVCRMVRKRCPDAKVVIGCWGLEDEIDAIRPRLKDAGAAAVCTTILEARGFVERSEIPVAQPVPPRASYALTNTRHAQN